MLAENTHTVTEAPGTVPDSAKKSAGRVLLVDNEWLVRWSVSEALRDRGIEVREAVDAASAMRLFDRAACDLVLLDLHLPDAHDFRVLSFIRAQAPSLPVMIMTAFVTREIIEEAAALGAAVIAKPFDLEHLTGTVERVLDGRVY
jgi:DNA-binding NtrC family response regulator